MPRSRPAVTSASTARRGLVPGGSEQFNRYKILRRCQDRITGINRRSTTEEDSSNSDHSLETDPDVEIQTVVNHVRTFANDLYLPLREKHPTNIVYSPFGFCVSASLLKLGCTGLCHEELVRALFPRECAQGDSDEDSDILIGISALTSCIKGGPDSFLFKHGYKFYIDVHHKPRVAFLNCLKAINPPATMEEIDFSNNTWETTSNLINRWSHNIGNNQLGDILTKRTTENKLILVNPMYFKGNWVHPFNPALTKDDQFFLNDKESVCAPMMTSGVLRNLLYSPINKLNCKALVLPYLGDRLGFVIFLPNQKSGLAVIETSLDSLSPAHYFEEMYKFRRKLSSQTGFKVILPRFRIDCTIDFESPMKEMGIEAIFQPGKTDFSDLVNISPKELNLTQTLQKVVIDVNELGSIKLPKRFQNAANMPQTSSSTAPDGTPFELIDFRVNHPFYFQVVDMKSDLIVFAGACRNPLQGQQPGFKEFLERYDIQVVHKNQHMDGKAELNPMAMNKTQ